MHQTVVVLIIILPVSIVNHHTSCISTSCDDVMPCASLIKTKIVGCLDYSYLCYIVNAFLLRTYLHICVFQKLV